MNPKIEYNQGIEGYIELLDEIQKVQTQSKRSGNSESSYVLMLDKERNELHNRLKELAKTLGKTEGDVNIDILSKRNSLRDYNLPEFKLIRLEDLNEFSDRIIYEKEGEPKRETIAQRFGDEPASEVFIPFGLTESWHMFDQKSFYQRKPETLEQQRKARLFEEENPNFGMYAEIEMPETFHQGIKLHGLLIKKESYDQVISRIAQKRERYSVLPQFLNKEQMEKDIKSIIEEDIEKIVHYGEKAEKNGTYETPTELLKRYKEQSVYDEEWVREILTEMATEKMNEIKHEKQGEDFEQQAMREGMGRRK